MKALMTLEPMRCFRALVATLLFACFCALTCESQEVATEFLRDVTENTNELLLRLEGQMSKIQTLQTDFTQEKRLAIMEGSFISRGCLFLDRPNRFAWHVREPVRFSLVVDGDIVRQWDEDTDKVMELPLSKNPAAQTALVQMKDWFSGAYHSLMGEYEVTILARKPTSIRFIPRNNTPASKVISSVTVFLCGLASDGAQPTPAPADSTAQSLKDNDERYIHQIIIEEKGGDRTEMTFTNTHLNEAIKQDAWDVRPRVQ